MLTNTGNPAYKAPEIVEGNEYTYKYYIPTLIHFLSEKVDLWQLGVIVFEGLTGFNPFYSPNIKQVLQNILLLEVNYDCEQLSKISESGKKFLKQLLNKDPTKRLSAMQAYKHPWIGCTRSGN